MPNIRSAAKQMRQSARRRVANRGNRSALRSQVRKLEAAIEAGDRKTAAELLVPTISVLGKAAQAGLIHKNNASRHISRLSIRVNRLSAESGAAA